MDSPAADAPEPAASPPTAEHPDHAGLLADAEAELTAINDALHRLDDDSYGRCLTCGEPIAEPRLEADPLALTCTGCAAVPSPA